MQNDALVPRSTEVGVLFKDSFATFSKSENLFPLLVGGLVLAVGSTLSFGILAGPLAYGWTDMSMRIARGERVTVDAMWSGFSKFGVTFILSCLLALSAVVGSIVIIGGIFLLFMFMFSFHELVASPHLGAVDAMKRSWDRVKLHVPDVAIAALASMGVIAVTATIIPGLGGLISGPFVGLLFANLYLRLTGPVDPLPPATSAL